MKDYVVRANIAYYSTLLDIKQGTLENTLGISRQTFNRKSRENLFTIRELKTLAKTLKCSVTDLVNGL
ncbi:helix-turn-helix domain-containing protein [Ruminococcus sp.]|uniref:helix-turn-helix domain-containing protein n=1 Tax=Ruminococcus sp. TaxID=41978 RepID=UPI00388E0B5C